MLFTTALACPLKPKFIKNIPIPKSVIFWDIKHNNNPHIITAMAYFIE